MTPRDLINVYSAADPFKAELIKNMLDAEGIQAFVDGGNQAGLTGLMTEEVKVLVEDGRAEEARQLISEHEAQVIADTMAETEEDDEADSESPDAPT